MYLIPKYVTKIYYSKPNDYNTCFNVNIHTTVNKR